MNSGLQIFLNSAMHNLHSMRFKIFNQWGQQIFESNSINQGWNGMYKGVPQSAQVVVWIVEGMGVDNKVYQKKGSTMLLR